MRSLYRRAAVLAAPLLATTVVAAAPTAHAAYPELVAAWEMNEPEEATVMVDSTGRGHDAPIDQAGLDTGYVIDGATAYRWLFLAPNAPPANPARIIQVPDSADIEPLSDTFTIEIRFRTKETFGNITQKGQSTSVGGQWKIQNPEGRPSCLFKGSLGRVSTRSKVALNDLQWHTLSCVRTPTEVRMYVDGVFMNRQRGSSGHIDNALPMTIGGKINCNQTTVTCDYFSGQIDYIRLTRG